jgi:hypothetical protein
MRYFKRCESSIQSSAGHCQLGREAPFWFDVVGCREVASGRCHSLPDGEGSQTQKSMIRRFQQVPS